MFSALFNFAECAAPLNSDYYRVTAHWHKELAWYFTFFFPQQPFKNGTGKRKQHSETRITEEIGTLFKVLPAILILSKCYFRTISEQICVQQDGFVCLGKDLWNIQHFTLFMNKKAITLIYSYRLQVKGVLSKGKAYDQCFQALKCTTE